MVVDRRRIARLKARAQAPRRSVLVDSETGEEYEAPEDIFLRVMGALGSEEPEPDPLVAEIIDRLNWLYYRESGEAFWLRDMTHTGKAAANEE
jgi:hypothetical protein